MQGNEDVVLRNLLKAKNSKNLWYNFDTLSLITDEEVRGLLDQGILKSENVSSIPDIFPVIGDLDAAVSYYLPSLVEYVKNKKQISEESPFMPEEKFTMVKGLYGFQNPTKQMNYCFMDSILLAMFSLEGNPFYENLIEKDFKPGPDRICGKNSQEDLRIRKKIQEQLREDVAILLQGKRRYTCSTLRKLIGKDCRLNETEEDMSVGTHDASQLYIRLMNALNYKPIIDTEFKETRHSNGKWLPATAKRPQESTHLTIRADSTDRISWPDTWNSGKLEEVRIGTENLFVRTAKTIVKADVLVVHLDRSLWNRKKERIDMSLKEISVDEVMRIEFENGGSQTYTLQTVVYAPYFGHYNCLIKSKGKWYVYDDTKTSKTIEMTVLNNRSALETIRKKAIVLFYF